LCSLQPALLNEERQEKIIFDISASEAEKEILFSLLEAIEQSKRISFAYIDAYGQMSERKIEPLNLLWAQGNWYVDGYCLLRKEKRLFRGSRITKLEMLEETFQRRLDPKRPIHTEEQGLKVYLRF